MQIEIVKVQRPIMTTDPAAPWLIYDEAEKHVESSPGNMVAHHIRKSMGQDYKAFFRAEWMPSVHQWRLIELVKDQEW